MRQLRHRGPVRARRAFSLVEALVAFVLFLTVAAMVTWSMTAAFAARTSAQERADVAAVLSGQMDALTSLPTPDLVAGTFTVPNPCPQTPDGIEGQSCVLTGPVTVRVAYRFPDPAAPDAAVCPQDSADPAAVLAATGAVQVQGCVVALTSAAFVSDSPSGAVPGVATQTRAVTGQDPGALSQGRKVVVHLSGATASSEDLTVHLLAAADTTTSLVSGPVPTDGVVRLDLTPEQGSACTPATPCVLGLSTGAQFTRTTSDSVLELVDVAGAGTPVTVPDRSTAHLYATIETR